MADGATASSGPGDGYRGEPGTGGRYSAGEAIPRRCIGILQLCVAARGPGGTTAEQDRHNPPGVEECGSGENLLRACRSFEQEGCAGLEQPGRGGVPGEALWAGDLRLRPRYQ